MLATNNSNKIEIEPFKWLDTIGEYQIRNQKPQSQAKVTIAVGLPNKNPIINSKNSFTKQNYKWWFDNKINYNGRGLGTKPYNGLVGGFKDDYNYIFVAGNDIDGLLAAVKRLISARSLFFSNFNIHRVKVIDDLDVSGISVADLLRNPSNYPYYNQRNSPAFANVVERILNNNNFEIAIKTVKTYNDNTTLRLKNINSDFSANFTDAVTGSVRPVVMAGGIWSNLFRWQEFGTRLAFDQQNGRDIWLIEVTGGPEQEERANSPNYNYSDLIDYYWPALITGVQNYSGKKNLDYLAHSNGCRVGLDSLKNWKNGKNSAGYIFDSTTGTYIPSNLGSDSVNTFIGLGCPGAFDGDSLFMECFGLHGQDILNFFEQNGNNHPTQREIGQRLAEESNNLRCGNILPRALNQEKRISNNLGSYYLNLIQSNQDPQPGAGLSLNRFAIIYGNQGYQFNNDNDYIVPVADELAIFDNINSSDKRNYQRFYRHDDLPDANEIQEIIINELR